LITKVKKGTGFEGLVSYNIDGVGRIMIGGNMAGRTPRELSREAGQFRKLRPTLNRAVAHLMLSAAPEDPYLDSETWCEIAETLLKDLGLQACPHVIVRHTDTAHQHIHIACLRIGPDGKTVPETNDRYKAERSVARIEKQYGLRQVNLKKNARQRVPVRPRRRHPTSQSTSPYQPTPRRKECNRTKPPNHNQNRPRSCRSRLM
jgi:hypothetical protein